MNSQYFEQSQIENGSMQSFLNCLLAEAYNDGSYYNDIRIHPEDCGAFMVEWEQLPWDHSYGGGFQYINEDQRVMTEYTFPDRHIEWLDGDDEFADRLNNFLTNNPGWIKTPYGTWTCCEDTQK